jgi:hypothetical protein
MLASSGEELLVETDFPPFLDKRWLDGFLIRDVVTQVRKHLNWRHSRVRPMLVFALYRDSNPEQSSKILLFVFLVSSSFLSFNTALSPLTLMAVFVWLL